MRSPMVGGGQKYRVRPARAVVVAEVDFRTSQSFSGIVAFCTENMTGSICAELNRGLFAMR